MSNKTDRLRLTGEVTHYCKIYQYPCGVVDILSSSKPMFREAGWEDARWTKHRPLSPEANDEATAEDEPEEEAQLSFSLEALPEPEAEHGPKGEDIARSMRRARSRVRRLALSNEFRWFVTLTLSPDKVDRYDAAQVVRKLSTWCSNQVKRRGLQYILVPERHKDGALHFHGFFNDALEAVASGHRDKQGHMIYNLPGWTLGFTAAIEVYGDYAGAVAYVCKYIGKQGDKPAGRWYYSGGDLREPTAIYGEISPADLRAEYGDRVFCFEVPGASMAVINGLRPEKEDNNHDQGGNYGSCCKGGSCRRDGKTAGGPEVEQGCPGNPAQAPADIGCAGRNRRGPGPGGT